MTAITLCSKILRIHNLKKINNYESLNPNTISDSQNSKPWNRIYLMC